MDLSQTKKPTAPPKRFVRSQIPDSILHDAALNTAVALLPSNYNFEVHKCVWRVRSTHASRVALQLPEGLLMYSLVLSDILSTFGGASQCFVLGDATYGACCIDDLAAKALDADLLIHFGHSCLVPLHVTTIPCLYVFVEISIDVSRLIETVHLSIQNPHSKTLVLAGTIQFASAIRAAKPELEARGFKVLNPQSKPLSAGEVLGCTAPKIASNIRRNSNQEEEDKESIVVFVADGRFHLEAIMIANPELKAFRYDPYLGKLFLEEYDQKGMRESRKSAILKAKEASNWGVVLGTLGRQGNPRILQRLEKKLREKGFAYTVVLMSEISPPRIALFEDSVDAWIQIACPRLSIDWGDAFKKPLLNPFEADIALGLIPGWWDKTKKNDVGCCGCANGNGAAAGEEEPVVGDYPMDYYALDGGEWNSSYVNKPSRPLRSDCALATAANIE
ncbi:2-(3-amino-3-carboxypropyl)histidine synthase subunit 1 [Prunus avium]|uniref:2-(3-amino-3-carboxypropyl)histidine synthase subunit 1 n=1 Tax=Prunus avium TaxID=42229 RepID=A0A6P5T8M7_PRUAV|nr:2-(3-amino-3-carboxypropyl)histidine synthase subunit 1 [Prunus avium]